MQNTILVILAFFLFVTALIFPYVWAASVDLPENKVHLLDFDPDKCLCNDLYNTDNILVGKACMCESTDDWPGKVLLVFLTEEGDKEMGNTFNGLKGFRLE